MSRWDFTLRTAADRAKVLKWITQAPWGFSVTIKEPKRTTEQNDRLWASLTDVSRQCLYHGLRLDPDDWKIVFMAALNKEMRIVPNLDNTGFVNLGQSSGLV